jgi:ketosteroid isomerase-like protein
VTYFQAFRKDDENEMEGTARLGRDCCRVRTLQATKDSAGPAHWTDNEDTAARILSLERAALDRWVKGDPDGFLEISAPEVVYFDPFQPKRLNGHEELRKLYHPLRGKVNVSGYELIDPKVTVSGNMAVLTFNFLSEGSAMRWNTTEVYRRQNGAWRIIHSHWSLTQPKLQS